MAIGSCVQRRCSGKDKPGYYCAMAAATEVQSVEARPRAAIWMGLAALAALALAGGTLGTLGAGKTGVEAALRLTARLGFLLFWPSYAASGLATLFGERWRPLGRYARVLGMAFAAVLAVHLTLVAWFLWIGAALPLSTFVIFGAGAICAYTLLLLSVDQVRRAMSLPAWRLVQTIGTNYILFAFAYDFLRPQPLSATSFVVLYLPFDILVFLGPVLRLLAWMKKRRAA
jgi:hypothetical protein